MIGAEMKYVIEHDGVLVGPFLTEREAAEFALAHYTTPWRLRSIHIAPPADAGED